MNLKNDNEITSTIIKSINGIRTDNEIALDLLGTNNYRSLETILKRQEKEINNLLDLVTMLNC